MNYLSKALLRKGCVCFHISCFSCQHRYVDCHLPHCPVEHANWDCLHSVINLNGKEGEGKKEHRKKKWRGSTADQKGRSTLRAQPRKLRKEHTAGSGLPSVTSNTKHPNPSRCEILSPPYFRLRAPPFFCARVITLTLPHCICYKDLRVLLSS